MLDVRSSNGPASDELAALQRAASEAAAKAAAAANAAAAQKPDLAIPLAKANPRDRFQASAAGGPEHGPYAGKLKAMERRDDTCPKDPADAANAYEVVSSSKLSLWDKLRVSLALDGRLSGAQNRASVTALANAPDATQKSLLLKIAAEPDSDTTRNMAQVLGSPAYASASPDQQAKIADLVDKTAPEDLPALSQMVANPTMMQAKDANGGTLVDNLDTIANQPLNTAINNATPQSLLHSVLDEALSPKTEIGQSDYGTCTVTSLQYALAAKQPAEYARLVAGLSSTAGTAIMAGGGQLNLQTEYYQSHLNGDDRSPAESMFQSAAMDYGDGEDAYNASTDKNQAAGETGTQGGGGLSTSGQSAVASQLFGHPYVTDNLNTPQDASNALDKLKLLDDQNLKDPVIVDVKLGDLNKPGYHAMEYQKTENGQVYFRNPWGPGNFMPVEGMTCVDPAKGVYTMSEDDFKQRAFSMSVPASEPTRSSGGMSTQSAAPRSASGISPSEASSSPAPSPLKAQIAAEREARRWANVAA